MIDYANVALCDTYTARPPNNPINFSGISVINTQKRIAIASSYLHKCPHIIQIRMQRQMSGGEPNAGYLCIGLSIYVLDSCINYSIFNRPLVFLQPVPHINLLLEVITSSTSILWIAFCSSGIISHDNVFIKSCDAISGGI